MTDKKKAVFNFIFLILVFSLTVYMVFKGEDLGEIISTVQQANAVYLMISVICVVLFILGESVIIFYMMRTLGAGVKMGHCALYSFVGFFFSCITPSATGGQPMQIYYMKKDKLPIPVTTLVLMIVTIHLQSGSGADRYSAMDIRKGISDRIFRTVYVGILSWCGAECVLCFFYDDSGVCTWTCQMAHGKGNETAGTFQIPETQKKQTGEAGKFHRTSIMLQQHSGRDISW